MKVKLGVLSIIAVVVLSISACSQKTTEESISDAREWVKKNDPEAAILELKNAIRSNPTDPTARFELGKVYLDRGMVAEAEKELRVALENKQDENMVLPLLAKALLHQFKNQELITLVNESKNLSLEAATTLYALQAQAYFLTGNIDAAEKAILSANELSADSPYARLGQAYAAFNKADIDIALETVDTLLANQSDFGEALLLKGQLENAKGRNKEALKSFEKYHELQPNLIQGRIYLADSYIKNKQYDDAEKHVDIMLKINRNSPFINQLKSQIRYELKDFVNAKLYAEIAIKNGGQNQLTRSIAGASSYQLGQSEQAYRHLLSIVDNLPANHELRGLFELLEYSLGYTPDGETDLETLNQLGEQNVGLLINSGLELVRKGKIDEAQKFIEVIDSSKISDPIELTRLSMLKLALNDKSAVADLQRVLETEPNNTQTKVMLAKAYLVDSNADKALEIANEIIKSAPKEVDGYNLAGLIYASQSKTEDASAMYTKTLEVSPKDTTANIYFGKVALSIKDFKSALNSYRVLVNLDPIYLPAITTYYQLERIHGDSDQAILPIKRAYESKPEDIKYALFYAKLLQLEKQYSAALDILSEIPSSVNLPDSYWQLYVDIYIKLDKMNDLDRVLNDWIAKKPDSGLSWRSIATHFEGKGDIRRALQFVQRGLRSSNTGSDNLMVLEAQYLLYLNNKTEAQEVIAQLAELYGEENPVVNLLQGQLLILDDKYADAEPLLMANYNLKASTKVLKLLLNGYVKTNQKQKAILFVEEHLKSFPEDNAARLYLANLSMEQDVDRSESQYREVLKSEPLNRIALNNLAAILQQKGQNEEAVLLSKSALDSAPDEPYLLEIYANALLKNDQANEAITMYAKAYNMSGKKKEYALMYVEVLRANNNEVMAQKISAEANL